MSARRSLGRALVGAAALVALAGCAAVKEEGREFPASARAKFVLEQTTPQQVEQALGKPVKTASSPDGSERWTYEHTRVSALRAVPFGQRVTVQQTPFEQLTLTFRDGRLRECVYAVERYRTEGELIVADGATRESCGGR